LNKTFIGVVVLVAVSVAIVACGGGSKSSSSQHKVSGLKYRAFVSNPLFPAGVSNTPVINIVDATQDLLSQSTISLIGTTASAGLMAVSPDLSKTLVFSQIGNTIAVVDNTTEAIATVTGSTAGVPAIALPGLTESMYVAKDNVTAYAAVPSAPVTGQSPGAVFAIDTGSGNILATIPVPGAHFIVPSPDGTNILVFSDGSDSITVISTALLGSNENPVTTVNGFDRPVWAIFIDSADAYIFNCGSECGGAAAGIATFTIGDFGPSSVTPVSGATYGMISGNTLYVAGTPPHTACPSGTAAKTCGTLTTLDAGSLVATNVKPILITDGYHNRMQMGDNGQLFIGSHSCTSINVSGGEVRGCLSIFNTAKSTVVIPPQSGDTTGIQPVTGRNVVYVCEGGVFQVFDTTTDQLLVQTIRIIIVGQSTDVKLVDPPPD